MTDTRGKDVGASLVGARVPRNHVVGKLPSFYVLIFLVYVLYWKV